MEKLTVEQIESIKFNPIGVGEYPYKLKRIEVKHQAANVSGCIRIGYDYYEKEYDMQTQPPVRANRDGYGSMRRFSINRLFD